jgi:hypothetical protein
MLEGCLSLTVAVSHLNLIIKKDRGQLTIFNASFIQWACLGFSANTEGIWVSIGSSVVASKSCLGIG